MKKNSFFLVLLLSCVAVSVNAQTCSVGTLDSQSAIDNFSANHPGCIQISGKLVIRGNDISNVNGLSQIQSVTDGIELSSNPILSSVSGLSSLKTVEGLFRIYDNDALGSLNGLNNLTSSEMLDVWNNQVLTDVSALSSLTSCKRLYFTENPSLPSLPGLSGLKTLEFLGIARNTVLTSISGLSGLTKLTTVNGGGLTISDNPALTSLTGLDNLTRVEGAFQIYKSVCSLAALQKLTYLGERLDIRNSTMTSLTGLNAIKNINGVLFLGYNPNLNDISALASCTYAGSVYITQNPELTSLDGIKNMNGMSALTATESGKLADCGYESICLLLTDGSNRYADFHGNATGCSSREQVLTIGCAVFPVKLVSFSGTNTHEGNRLEWTTSEEMQNKGFWVESSPDANQFSALGFIKGQGNSNVTSTYSFTDAKPESLTYYRLKQEDWDGSFTYSKIIGVRSETSAFSVYPNPVTKEFFIDTQQRNRQFKLKNLSGYTVMESNLLPKSVNVNNIRNGIYILNIGSESIKILVNND